MRTTVKLIVVAAVSAWLVGCEQVSFGPSREPAEPTAPAQPEKARGSADYMMASAVRGGEDVDGQGAVDVALEWSRKYAHAAEELLKLQKSDKQLTEENRRLLAQTAKLQIELEQSKKELSEANDMLVEMGKELREWKANVLGFRGEMQQAQQVQMEAIKKIMVLLGGEVTQPKPKTAEKPEVTAKDTTSELPKG